MNFSRKELNKGSVLLVTVFTFLVLMVVMGASARFINRQYRATINTEAEAAAFRIADDGLDYAIFLLGSGTKTVPDLVNGAQPLVDTVVDPFTNESSGTFSMTFVADSAAPTEALQITSVGRSSLGNSQCYTIVANVGRVSGSTIYRVNSWETRSGC